MCTTAQWANCGIKGVLWCIYLIPTRKEEKFPIIWHLCVRKNSWRESEKDHGAGLDCTEIEVGRHLSLIFIWIRLQFCNHAVTNARSHPAECKATECKTLITPGSALFGCLLISNRPSLSCMASLSCFCHFHQLEWMTGWMGGVPMSCLVSWSLPGVIYHF